MNSYLMGTSNMFDFLINFNTTCFGMMLVTHQQMLINEYKLNKNN